MDKEPRSDVQHGPKINYVVEYQPTSAQEFGVQLAVKSVV